MVFIQGNTISFFSYHIRARLLVLVIFLRGHPFKITGFIIKLVIIQVTNNSMFGGFGFTEIFSYEAVNKGVIMHGPVFNILLTGFSQNRFHGFYRSLVI